MTIKNVGPIFWAFFFGFGGPGGNPLENLKKTAKKPRRPQKLKF